MKNKSLLTPFIILIFFACSCNKEPDSINPRFKYLELPPMCSVFDLSIDKANNKWIGTDRGLIKYSKGAIFYTRANGLASDTVGDVATDSNGNVWCLTSKGISQYNGTAFISHRPILGPDPGKFYPGPIMTDTRNNLWMCNKYGLCRYNGKSWEYFKGNFIEEVMEQVEKIQPDPENENNILIFTFPYNNIIRFDGTKFEKPDSLYGEAAQDISCISRGNNGVIYFGVDMKGIMIRKDGKNTLVSLGPDFRDNIIYDIKPANENQIWVNSFTNIFLVINENTIIPSSGGLSGGFWSRIHLDAYNKPWIKSGMVYYLYKL